MANLLQRWRARKTNRDTGPKQVSVHTAEGLVLDLTLASPFQRAVVVVLDQIVVLIALVLLIVAYFYSGIATTMNTAFATILFYLTTFFLRTFGLMVQEMVWNGRTLAKMWFGMRVVSLDGTGLKPGQVLVRNLVREMEFFLPMTFFFSAGSNFTFNQIIAVVILLITTLTILLSRRSQRLGDYLANTVVIMDPRPVLLADLAVQEGAGAGLGLRFTPAQLDHYGRHELHVLEDVLRVQPASDADGRARQLAKQVTIAEAIAKRIGWTEPVGSDSAFFLSTFYTAQRDHLERKRLMGDVRDDKFHRAPKAQEDRP